MVGQKLCRAALSSGGRLPRVLALWTLFLCLLGGGLAAVVPATSSGASSVGGDQTQIGQLEQRLATDGARIQTLVVRFDKAQARAEALKVRLTATHVRLAGDRQAQARASSQLRTVAVDAYVSGGGLDAPALLTSSASTRGMASVYVDVAGRRLRSAVDTFQFTEAQTRAAAVTLGREEGAAQATMRALVSDQRSAEAAVIADNNLLSRVKGNMQGLIAAAAARRARAALRAERLLAQREAAAAAATAAAEAPTPATPTASASPGAPTPPTAPPAPAAPTPAPGGYADPLRAMGGLSPERIDQGVDYGGYGPIYALGDGVVLSTVNGGWPGGTFIAYRLTDGPAAGLVVYAAEDIDPIVQVGQAVTASTEIGLAYAGPDGIETGWAAPGGLGNTMAASAGQFGGGNTTAYGANFSLLLQSLGAPGGAPQNSPPTGGLPSGWPAW